MKFVFNIIKKINNFYFKLFYFIFIKHIVIKLIIILILLISFNIYQHYNYTKKVKTPETIGEYLKKHEK